MPWVARGVGVAVRPFYNQSKQPHPHPTPPRKSIGSSKGSCYHNNYPLPYTYNFPNIYK